MRGLQAGAIPCGAERPHPAGRVAGEIGERDVRTGAGKWPLLLLLLLLLVALLLALLERPLLRLGYKLTLLLCGRSRPRHRCRRGRNWRRRAQPYRRFLLLLLLFC